MSATILVTGASKGIGRAIAELFLQKGWCVIGTYCHNPSWLAESRENLIALQVDFSDYDNVEAFLQQLPKNISVLVNNAAVSVVDLFQCVPKDQALALYHTNLLSPIALTRGILPQMLARHEGCIVNISSMWGQVGASCEVDYSVTKGGLLAFTKALAQEVGPSGIRVNAVSPGTIDTEMNAHLTKEDLEALAEETPLNRIGSPMDVAHAVEFLVSDQAAYITGQNLAVNGGFIC